MVYSPPRAILGLMKLPDFSHNGLFSWLAFDDVLEFSEKTGVESAEVDHTIARAVQAVSEGASGVIVYPPQGFSATTALAPQTSLIFELSKMSIPKDPLSVPVLSQYGIDASANTYAAVKLELYYNPTEEEARSKKQMVAELSDSAKLAGTPFILDLIMFLETSQESYQAEFLQKQLDAVQELRGYCDAFILEFPVDALNAVTLTAQLDIPWLVSGRDMPYDEFKQNVRIALESGAAGYVMHDQLLPDKPITDPTQLDSWFATTARDRTLELQRILHEAS